MEKQTYSRKQVICAYLVHFYTATGAIFAVLAMLAIIQKTYAWAYLWLGIAVIIDSSDGTLARKFKVKLVLPHINGRKLDDIIDFLNYTFIPLILIWQKKLLPEPMTLWIVFPLLASLFAFVFEGVKEEDAGFFVGFPSYWNFFAIYADIGLMKIGGPWLVCALLLFFSLLNVLPLRFVYPSMATRWKGFFIWGGILWAGLSLYMLTWYQQGVPMVLVWLSFIYPFLYLVLSLYLDFSYRKRKKKE